MKKLTCKTWAKAVAYVLFVAMVLLVCGCAVGASVSYDQEWRKNGTESALDNFASRYVYREMSYLTRALSEGYYHYSYVGENATATDPIFSYVITDDAGNVLADTRTEASRELYNSWSCFMQDAPPEAGDDETINMPVPTVTPSATALPTQDMAPAGQTVTVTGYLNLPVENSLYSADLALFNAVIQAKQLYIPLGVAALIIGILLFVFLMVSAGRVETAEGIELVRRGLCRVPLDASLVLCVAAAVAGGAILSALSYYSMPLWLTAVLVGAFIAIIAVAAAAFFMGFAANVKTGGWWRNTLIFIVCRWFVGLIKRIIAALPLVWRTALAYVGFMLINLIIVVATDGLSNHGFLVLLIILFDLAVFAVVIFTALHLRLLQKGGQALAAGDLTYTVDTSKMRYALKEHGENLNSISLGISRAVDERLKSERFKTELITNVSHDLKTPLTSIVSYVDLLKKEDIQNDDAKEYIEVLDRQSAKLKKLTEDLVDASKASSGVMQVNPEKLDLGELASQCAGEYAERLHAAGVEPIVSSPADGALIIADGRLLGRVLDNLMQNVVKYAMPGTRAYLSVERAGSRVLLSVKNISREPLNIPAAELMERFVRGDASRHTEGSGLGLSIAQSLTELMGGALELSLDGDLFKVTLSFDTIS